MIQKNDVMLLHIHKNKVDRIELTDIARQFIQTNERRKKFFGTVQMNVQKFIIIYFDFFFTLELIINTFIEYTNNKSLISLENTFN